MKIKFTTILLAIILSLITTISLKAQETNIEKKPSQKDIKETIQQLIEMAQVKIENMSFENENGENIDIKTFTNLTLQDRLFNIVKDSVTKKAILKIRPINSEKENAQAPKNNFDAHPTEEKINKTVVQLSKQITEMMQIKIENVTFKDTTGKKINIQTFTKFMLQGLSWDTVKDTVTNKAIFSLNPIDADKSTPIVKQKLNIKIGDLFPQFDFSSSENSKISLESLKGKPTFLSLYFVTCIPCIQEIPLLNHLQLTKGSHVNFLALTMDSLEDVNKFNEKYYFKWNSLVDASGLIEAIGVKTFPTYILLDKNSTIIDIQSGFGSDKTQQVLNSMLHKIEF